MPEYVTTNEVIEVLEHLDEAAFHRVNEILGEPPPFGNYKGWSTHFVFEATGTGVADRVCAFLRSVPVAHSRAAEKTWMPS